MNHAGGRGLVLSFPTAFALPHPACDDLQAERGKMKYIIGDGKNRMDFTYVGNVAQAHLQAADALALGSKLAGQAYFITNQVRVCAYSSIVCQAACRCAQSRQAGAQSRQAWMRR